MKKTRECALKKLANITDIEAEKIALMNSRFRFFNFSDCCSLQISVFIDRNGRKVNVTFRTRRIPDREGSSGGFWEVLLPPGDQVGVGEEGPADGDEVCSAGGDEGRG